MCVQSSENIQFITIYTAISTRPSSVCLNHVFSLYLIPLTRFVRYNINLDITWDHMIMNLFN